MSAKKIECNCKEVQCSCGLPLFMMDHLQLPCCNEAKYHVLCISNHTKCLKCKKDFNEHVILFVQNAQAIIMQKFRKEQSNELKRLKARKKLQLSIIDKIFVKYFN